VQHWLSLVHCAPGRRQTTCRRGAAPASFNDAQVDAARTAATPRNIPRRVAIAPT